MPLNAVKTHQGQLRRVALGKCIYLKIGYCIINIYPQIRNFVCSGFEVDLILRCFSSNCSNVVSRRTDLRKAGCEEYMPDV